MTFSLPTFRCALGILALGAMSGFAPSCSVVAYSPVVVGSALGLHEDSLHEDPYYGPMLARPFRLTAFEGETWYLKELRSGRHLIEGGWSAHASVPTDLDLTHATLVLEDIYQDAAYAAILFDATVHLGDREYPVRGNPWSEAFAASIEFHPIR